MTKLIALKAFPYSGRHLKPGQAFDASDRDARLFLALRRAAPFLEARAAPEPEKRPRRPRKVSSPEPQLVMEDPQPRFVAAPEPAHGVIGHHYATRQLLADPQ